MSSATVPANVVTVSVGKKCCFKPQVAFSDRCQHLAFRPRTHLEICITQKTETNVLLAEIAFCDEQTEEQQFCEFDNCVNPAILPATFLVKTSDLLALCANPEDGLWTILSALLVQQVVLFVDLEEHPAAGEEDKTESVLVFYLYQKGKGARALNRVAPPAAVIDEFIIGHRSSAQAAVAIPA